MNKTPPKVCTQQNTPQQLTQRSWPQMKATRKQKRKDHGLIRATASVQRLGISEEKGTLQVRSRRGVSRHRFLTQVGGEAHTVPRPGTWGHTPTVSKVTPPPQPLLLEWHDPCLDHQVSAGWTPKVTFL